jgi:hypothetical protein
LYVLYGKIIELKFPSFHYSQNANQMGVDFGWLEEEKRCAFVFRSCIKFVTGHLPI